MPADGAPDWTGWCRRWLGGEPVCLLFEHAHLSRVAGLVLADGRRVVVKARPPAARIAACADVQRRLWAAGFPCPAPLAGPAPCGSMVATAEALVEGGGMLASGPGAARASAAALHRLMALAPEPAALPALSPAPPWVGWDHGGVGTWPWPDDCDADLNAHGGPAWLDDLGARLRARLSRSPLPEVVGHADWEAHNLRWRGATLHAVHDWDSIAVRPEAALAGAAAATFTATGQPLSEPTPAESAEFLQGYEDARRRPWSREEREVAWAAGLWVRAFNAKKAALAGPASEPVLARLAGEVAERSARAGL